MRKQYQFFTCPVIFPTYYYTANSKIVGNIEIVLTHDHFTICYPDGLCQMKADFTNALKLT